MNGGIVVYVSIRMSKQWEIDVNLYSLIFKTKKVVTKINILLTILLMLWIFQKKLLPSLLQILFKVYKCIKEQ